MKLKYYLLFLLGFSLSCSEGQKHKTNQTKADQDVILIDTNIKKGVVYEKLNCVTDSTINFAIYLPSYYLTKKNWPTIYIFDAQARGTLPISLYKEFAEKFGYILISSNNSKNGMSWETNSDQIKILIDNTYKSFAIDKQRIYTMGFSGGSRVACSVAIFLGGIEGVIGCAAGFPNLDKPIQNKFSYLGFSGNEDFNYVEMNNLDNGLSQTGLDYQIIYFNGKHDWPPAPVMKDAFYWMEFNAMRSFKIPVDSNLIKDFLTTKDKTLKELEKSGNIYDYYLLLKQSIHFLEGIKYLKNEKVKLDEIAKSEKYKKAANFRNNQLDAETNKQKEYLKQMTIKDINWWVKEIGNLEKYIKNSKNKEEVAFSKRLKNYISLTANLSTLNALKSNQTDETAYYLAIYGMADPENPDYLYFSAYFFAREKQNDKALAMLEKAVKFKFKDKKKLENEPVFESLRGNKRFIELLKKID